MFDDFIKSIKTAKICRAKEQKLKRENPIKYLRFRTNRAKKFVNTVKSMLQGCSLMLIHDRGTYRAIVTLDSIESSMEYQTFGYIFGDDFFLDCDLVYEAMIQSGKDLGPSKREYFRSLFREGILKPYCHFKQYLWFKHYYDMDRVKGHKFYCISKNLLVMKWTNFIDVYVEI